jgi:hypothetical protein
MASAIIQGQVGITPLGTFYYSSLQTMLVYWQVEPEVAAQLMPPGIDAAVFDGKALVNLNFERYASIGGTYDGIVNEVEFNVVAAPTRLRDTAFELTTAEFLAGADEAKIYGNYRVQVACDSAVAVQAGSAKYGENKFVAAFPDYSVPGANAPGVTAWSIPCMTQEKGGELIFQLDVPSMPGAPTVTPSSPIADWATLVGSDGKTRLVQSGRNVFGIFQSWFTTKDDVIQALPAGTATVTIGTVADNPMVSALSTAFDGNEIPVAIALFDSAPAAASTHTLLDEPLD